MTNTGKLLGIRRLRSRGPLIEGGQDSHEDEPTEEEIREFRLRHPNTSNFSDEEIRSLMEIDSQMLKGYILGELDNFRNHEGGISYEQLIWSQPVENYAKGVEALDELEAARAKL